jgi:hypothetical protein
MLVTRHGVWTGVTGFTEHLELATTNNYNAIADLHTLQFIVAYANSFQFVFTSRW